MDKVQKPSSKNTAQVPPLDDHDSIFIEIPEPKAMKTVQEPNSPEPNSYQPKLPYPDRMKQLGLGALKPTRMTLELANRSVTHPMGIAEDVVVRVDGFTFLADFVVVNFEPDPRVPIILGRPFLRTAKALIDLYEEKLTLRVGNDELVFYAEKSEKSKNKQFAHAISVIDFSKDEPFSGSTTIHSDALPPSSSPVKTSDNTEEFADELTLLKKDVQEENFQVYSNPLFEFDDNFNSSNENPLFDEMVEDVVNENSNVSNSDELVLLNTPLSDKVECSDPEVDIDEIDAFLAMKVSSNFEEDYYDSEGDVIFLENLLSDDTTHNLSPEVISDHEPKQNESIHNTSIIFSPRHDPLHHEFAGELLTLPSRNVCEHEEYLSLMTLLCVENDDSKDEDNSTFRPNHELPNLDHQDNPSSPRPPPEPPDVKIRLEPNTAVINNFDVLNKDSCFNLEEGVRTSFFTPASLLFIFLLSQFHLLSVRTNEFRDRVKLSDSVTKNKALRGRHPMDRPNFSEDSRVKEIH
ncbi:reverse transcriptase domain-containing protein [Tanacetum coccineum]